MHNALIAKSHENASKCIYTKCIIERKKDECAHTRQREKKAYTKRRTEHGQNEIRKMSKRARQTELWQKKRNEAKKKNCAFQDEKLLHLKINNVAYKFIEAKCE